MSEILVVYNFNIEEVLKSIECIKFSSVHFSRVFLERSRFERNLKLWNCNEIFDRAKSTFQGQYGSNAQIVTSGKVYLYDIHFLSELFSFDFRKKSKRKSAKKRGQNIEKKSQPDSFFYLISLFFNFNAIVLQLRFYLFSHFSCAKQFTASYFPEIFLLFSILRQRGLSFMAG